MAAITVPGPANTSLRGNDEKLRDSAIDIDIDVNICGVLEHAVVKDGWETDTSDAGSSLLEEEKETSIDDSLTESLLPSPLFVDGQACRDESDSLVSATSFLSLNSSTSSLSSSLPDQLDHNANETPAPRPFSAPPGPLLEAAINGGNRPYEAYYDMSAYGYATAVQPAFPTVFDLFDYGDGTTYYLGGGGPRITRHLSQRGRGVVNSSFWPFANPPLYACRLHHPSTGRPPIVLYGGPNADQNGAWADVQFRGFTIKSVGSLGNITIGLPPMVNSRRAWQPFSEEEVPDGRTDETLHAHIGWHKRYRFEVEVEADGPASFLSTTVPRREAFEWRYCSSAGLEALEEDETVGDGEEAEELEETVPKTALTRRFASVRDKTVKAGQHMKRTLSIRKKQHTKSATEAIIKTNAAQSQTKQKPRWESGWQLVRLAEAADPLADAIQAAKSTPTTTTPSIHSSTASTLFLDQLIADEAGRAAARRRTPDGKEIVAIWANSTSKRMDDDEDAVATACMVSRFTFLGSGASGQLGERWALMAVASGLAVWERARRSRRRRQSTVVSACGGFANIGV